jgi:glycosyltransferase involved in cell wall biosynthesis
MHVLHLANNYVGSVLYSQFIKEIDKSGCSQTVYSAFRKCEKYLVNNNAVHFCNANSKIICRPILGIYERINFFYKKRKIYRDLLSQVSNLQDINFVHAHTWYSDGAIAWQLYKDYHIPYIITIRNTDWNVFYKYLIHTRKLGLKILLNAKQIIFISEVYKTKFLQSNICQKRMELISKCKVIPNGIDTFWICNVQNRKTLLDKPDTILYIGNFSANKNLKRLIAATESLIEKRYRLTLHVVGGGWDKSKIEQFLKTKNFIVYHGKIYDKNDLVKIIRQADIFAMPSIHETFGLVYIEALSQGIPVIYTKGEGIDGFYGSEIGEAVNALSIESIETGIKKIIDNYSDYNFNPSEIVKNHDWNKIAERYIYLYETI